MPDDASWLEGVVAPDDLSELQADIEAYHRELRQAARRRLVVRLTGLKAWQRLALPIAVAVGSLTVAGAVFAILTLGHPRQLPGPPAVPIASAGTLPAVGQVGGLLPAVTMRSAGGAVRSRDLRPALVALVPMQCNCTPVLSALAAQADETRVPLVVVAPTSRDAEVDSLPGRIHNGFVQPVFDLHGQLARTYEATGVTVLGLRPDATVSFIRYDVQSDAHLEPWLTQMVRPTESLRAR